MEPRPFRSIGAVAAHCAFGPVTVAQEYDGLIFFAQTSPSALLGW
jgi:hypothetical protein